MTEEVRFFRRLSLYALLIGVVYWFVSYEWAGTTLLIVFALGAGATTLLLWSGARAAGSGRGGPLTGQKSRATDVASVASGVTDLAPDGPFGDESGRIPSPTLAPFLVAVAVALAALGLVFGPWFLLVGVVPFAMGAHAWFDSARSELDAVEREAAAERR